VTWSANLSGTVEIRVGGDDCTEGQVASSGSYPLADEQRSDSLAGSGLAEGPNTVRVCVGGTTGVGQAAVTVTKDTVPPETSLTGSVLQEAGAQFTLASSEAGSTFECRVDGAPYAPCPASTSVGGLAPGTRTFQARAVDSAGNADETPATLQWVVAAPAPPPVAPSPLPDGDTAPPGAVRRLGVRAGDRVVRLSWTLPPDVDIDHVEVRRTATAGRARLRVIDAGFASALIDRKVENGVAYRYAVVVVDEAGNRSTAVSVTARPELARLVGPSQVRVGGAPLLRWIPIKRAAYYNLQLFRGGVKVLSVWPRRARIRLTPAWRWEGRGYALRPGRYTWYVWPGFGALAETRYGGLIGQRSFVVGRSPGG
jgi:hypothetical protein